MVKAFSKDSSEERIDYFGLSISYLEPKLIILKYEFSGNDFKKYLKY